MSGSGASHGVATTTALEHTCLEQARTIASLTAQMASLDKVIQRLRDEVELLEDGDVGERMVALTQKLNQATAHALTNQRIADQFFSLQSDWHDQLERMTQRWLRAVDQMQSLHDEIAGLREEVQRHRHEARNARFEAALVGGAA